MEYEKTDNVGFGIDFGAINSIIAFFDSHGVSIVPNLITNMNYTPSAVAIDDEGNIIVGESARKLSLYDPPNAAVEFNLAMGTNKKYHFEDSGMDLLPEELSAEVFKDLKNSVYQRLDRQIDSAAITVPADFSPKKILATEKAAKLAGFRFTPIIRKSDAAAYAYHELLDENVTCLIYDFDETTFESSIVKIDDDEFLNLSHSSDFHLGGNIIDWDIVNKIFAKKVSDDLGLNDFNRREIKYSKAFAKLKLAAEEARKDLYHCDNTKVFIDALMIQDREIYDFKYMLSKSELKKIMTSYIQRTLKHCRHALNKAQLNAIDIDYIILVGALTKNPIIKESLEDELGIPIKDEIDPMTVVARGAALFAATVPPYIPPPNEEVQLKLDYKSKGPDEDFYVCGEIISDKTDNFEGFKLEAVNIKTKRTTGKIYVQEDGFFEFELIPEDDKNVYEINVYDRKGNIVGINENSVNAIEYRRYKEWRWENNIYLGLNNDKFLILAENPPFNEVYHSLEAIKMQDVIKSDGDEYYISLPIYTGKDETESEIKEVAELVVKTSEIDKTVLNEITMKIYIDIKKPNVDFNFDLSTGESFELKMKTWQFK